jgi:hypothetical protein
MARTPFMHAPQHSQVRGWEQVGWFLHLFSTNIAGACAGCRNCAPIRYFVQNMRATCACCLPLLAAAGVTSLTPADLAAHIAASLTQLLRHAVQHFSLTGRQCYWSYAMNEHVQMNLSQQAKELLLQSSSHVCCCRCGLPYPC